MDGSARDIALPNGTINCIGGHQPITGFSLFVCLELGREFTASPMTERSSRSAGPSVAKTTKPAAAAQVSASSVSAPGAVGSNRHLSTASMMTPGVRMATVALVVESITAPKVAVTPSLRTLPITPRAVARQE